MIQSLDRGLHILFILAEHRSRGVTELAADLKVNKSTVFRLLETMEMRGLVQKDEITAKYRLGIGVLQISDGLIKNLDIIGAAKPVLQQLTTATKESSHLCTLTGEKVYIVDQVKCDYVMKVSAAIGQEEPIYCSSVGKSILAHLPEDKVNKIIEEIDFVRFTPKTIIGKKALLEDLARIRERGYAMDDEELSEGVRCIAAPIFNFKGDVKSSIGISGPTLRLDRESLDSHIENVKTAARKISYSMGYREG